MRAHRRWGAAFGEPYFQAYPPPRAGVNSLVLAGYTASHEGGNGVLVMRLHAMERGGDRIPVPSYDAATIEVSEDEVRLFTSNPLPSSSATP